MSLRFLFENSSTSKLHQVSARRETTPLIGSLSHVWTPCAKDKPSPNEMKANLNLFRSDKKSRSTTEQPLAVKSAACVSSALGVLKAHLRPKQPLQQRKIENDHFTLLKNLSSLSPHLSWHVLVSRLVSPGPLNTPFPPFDVNLQKP